MSHTCFFLLILIEHFIIILLPYLTSSSFPPDSCLDHSSYNSIAITVMTLWLSGVLFHLLHYSWSHPWATINGPQYSVGSVLNKLTRGQDRAYTEDYEAGLQHQGGYQGVRDKEEVEMTDIQRL